MALSLNGTAWAQSVEIEDYVGVEITAEDIEAGESELFRASLQGFNGTLAQWGRALVRGDGVEQDVDAGVKWLEVAAAQESVPALLTLGDIFAQGEYAERDPARAFDAYDRAVSLGDNGAYLRIGRMFESGRGGTPDPDRALAAYDEAVLLEVPGANIALARGHLDNRFGEFSEPELALEIFEQSGETTAAELRPFIGDALLRGKGLTQDVDAGLE
ncbi:MAG: tetratricopeptide repeat protein, partial [Pseudomonadota bacterium]